MKATDDFQIVDNDEIRGELNINYGGILMRHVDRIGLLSAKGLSIINAVKILFNLLKPYHDKLFMDDYNLINQKHNVERVQGYYHKLNNQSSQGTPLEEYYNEILGLLMSLMDRLNLLIEARMGWKEDD